MEVKKGTQRIVVRFPDQGIVFKFARIRVYVALKCFLRDAFKRRRWNMLRMRLRYPIGTLYGFRDMLFGGLVSNAMEFVFYATTRHGLAQPTYFTLFGLVNVMRYAKPCDLNSDVCMKVANIAGRRAVEEDLHHLAFPRNYTIDGGTPRLLDYGSPEARTFIRKHGDKVLREFKL